MDENLGGSQPPASDAHVIYIGTPAQHFYVGIQEHTSNSSKHRVERVCFFIRLLYVRIPRTNLHVYAVP